MTTKKHAFYGILALVSLFGLGMTQSAKANLVVNGGFETGDFTGWSVGGFVFAVPFLSHSGTWAAEFPQVGSAGSISQNIATTAGSIYQIDFWLSNPFGGTPSDFTVKWGGVTIFSLTDPPVFGYTEYTLNAVGLAGTTALEFDGRQDPTAFFLDDISVNAVGTPDSGSTVVLLGAAMIVVGLLHRRITAKRA